jgi:hypothetical protein
MRAGDIELTIEKNRYGRRKDGSVIVNDNYFRLGVISE